MIEDRFNSLRVFKNVLNLRTQCGDWLLLAAINQSINKHSYSTANLPEQVQLITTWPQQTWPNSNSWISIQQPFCFFIPVVSKTEDEEDEKKKREKKDGGRRKKKRRKRGGMVREEGTKKEIERKKTKTRKRRISLVWLTHICNSTYLGDREGMIPSVRAVYTL